MHKNNRNSPSPIQSWSHGLRHQSPHNLNKQHTHRTIDKTINAKYCYLWYLTIIFLKPGTLDRELTKLYFRTVVGYPYKIAFKNNILFINIKLIILVEINFRKKKLWTVFGYLLDGLLCRRQMTNQLQVFECSTRHYRRPPWGEEHTLSTNTPEKMKRS